jgi:hypothetical protein
LTICPGERVFLIQPRLLQVSESEIGASEREEIEMGAFRAMSR